MYVPSTAPLSMHKSTKLCTTTTVERCCFDLPTLFAQLVDTVMPNQSADIDTLARINKLFWISEPMQIYPIICLKSGDVRRMQFAILDRSPREMSQTDRIHPRYFLSRVRVSIRPRTFLYGKKPQTTVDRPTAVDRRSVADRQLNLNGRNPFSPRSSVPRAQRENAAITVQTPCREHYFFHFYCLRLTRLTLNKS